jgi:hypothetical protein
MAQPKIRSEISSSKIKSKAGAPKKIVPKKKTVPHKAKSSPKKVPTPKKTKVIVIDELIAAPVETSSTLLEDDADPVLTEQELIESAKPDNYNPYKNDNKRFFNFTAYFKKANDALIAVYFGVL